jgi:hypothetical protein
MKRRHFVRALVAAPVAPSLLAQQPSTSPAQARIAEEAPKLDVVIADQASDPVPHFFSQQQFVTLRRLCDVLMPPGDGTPGSVAVGVPEFLDFLIGESPAEKQQLYRAGLDALNAAARKKHAKAFADVDEAQVDGLLGPLHSAWTYEEPSDPLSRFLRAAKTDVRTATLNSREYSAAASTGGRRGGNAGLYWYPLD